MLLRKQYEQIEKDRLCRYATLSSQTKGRKEREEPCRVRTEFQRDRDRIIHCKAFRRLKHKTQVFIAPEADHFRTRLTHTLEVSQIARTIARALRLNEDLTEAIALGHDLGHTPFGHAGEEALNAVHPGGFMHNLQSLRVVDCLEQGKGLNLTWEVKDGIVGHTGDSLPQTLEGQTVRLADRIAYINHDIDDAIRAGIITIDSLPAASLDVLGKQHKDRINAMVLDTVAAGWGKDTIRMSPKIAAAMEGLREFLFEKVYISSIAKAEEVKAIRLIQRLYYYYVEQPRQLPLEYAKDYPKGNDHEQAVVDYLAGMTDRYAIATFQSLFVPSGFRMDF